MALYTQKISLSLILYYTGDLWTVLMPTFSAKLPKILLNPESEFFRLKPTVEK